jgi:hypothetical protein
MTPDEFAAQLEKLITEARDKGLSNDLMGEALVCAAEALIRGAMESDRSDNQSLPEA